MKINIEKTTDITPSLRIYIEEKLAPLGKYVKRFDAKGEPELWLEIMRTTRHHKKGEVFSAAADLRLPKKVLRAEESATDMRKAIDQLKDTLHAEIEKYRTQFIEHERGKKR